MSICDYCQTSVSNVGSMEPCEREECPFRTSIVPHRPRAGLIKAAEAIEQYHANVSVRPGPIPTPLYVTQSRGKGVLLRFNTQEEADAAWRYLSALAEAHADRTHKEQDATQKLLEEHSHKWPEPGTPEYEDMLQQQRESWSRQDKD